MVTVFRRFVNVSFLMNPYFTQYLQGLTKEKNSASLYALNDSREWLEPGSSAYESRNKKTVSRAHYFSVLHTTILNK